MPTPFLSADRLAWPTALLPGLRLLWTRTLFPGRADGDARLKPLSLALLLILPGLLLYPSLSFHLLEPDEGRYAEIPCEMLQRGEWVVPYLQGEPYLDKPPLLYWLVMLSYRLFGVSAASARLVPALAVHGCVLAAYLLGQRSLGERAAFRGALLLSLAPGLMSMGRILILDGLLTLCTTVALLAAFEFLRTGRRVWWLLAGVACGLGVLTKGPVAIVLLVPPLLAYRWLYRAEAQHSALSTQLWLRFIAVVLAINLPWYVAVCVRQPAFGPYFFWQHNVLRFLAPFDHLQPFWYYGPVLLGGLLPGTLLLIGFIRWLLSGDEFETQARSPELGFMLLAGGWCVLFFSLSGCKLPTYVLPAFPFLALALGTYVKAHPLRRVGWAGACFWFVLLAAVHHVGLPWYAARRSPMADSEPVRRACADPAVPVVCYPRNCDSVAFYLGRDDLRSARSKHVHLLVADLLERPRTVVLFTHRHSLDALRYALPAELRVTDVVEFKYHGGWIDKFAGDTPWGLCHLAVIERTDAHMKEFKMPMYVP